MAPFIPMLLPALKRAADETADLEAAGEAKSAVDALVKALGVGHVADRAKAGLSGRYFFFPCPSPPWSFEEPTRAVGGRSTVYVAIR